MSTNQKLSAAIAVSVLAATALFTAGRGLGRQPKADWNAEHWLRLLSGANGITRTQTGQVSRPDAAAEIIGRTGYQLYR
jgi:hypothetical protein